MTNAFRIVTIALIAAVPLAGCDKKNDQAANDGRGKEGGGGEPAAAPPTNRVDIPESVRNNLGITFAKVETRAVARTLRVPGQFELLPTARREHRTPLGGRVELLVTQYQRVDVGTPLYRVDSAAWHDLHGQIEALQAKVESMGPLRQAHRVHEQSLAGKVRIWEDRARQLEELRAAGGGSAAQLTEARATLNSTQAELADVMERDAELQAQQKGAEAELRALHSRRVLLVRASGAPDEPGGTPAFAPGDPASSFVVLAVAPGVVESLAITTGGAAEESGLIMTLVRPEQVRFRARGLQADLGLLRDGLPAAVVPPQGGSVALQDTMAGALQLGLIADADERTVELILTPTRLASWARAGVAAHMEISLDGGEKELAVPVSTITRDGARGFAQCSRP